MGVCGFAGGKKIYTREQSPDNPESWVGVGNASVAEMRVFYYSLGVIMMVELVCTI
jgi:hypothetical protein